MKQGNFSKEELNSEAYLSRIRIFIPRGVNYPSANRARFSPYRFQDPYSLFEEKEDGIIRNFPILFRGNGEPWDIGNLYLMHKMSEMAKFDQVTVATLATHATHLLAFLRWIEHNQSLELEINEFTFPDDPHERVTYAYRRYLMRQIRKVPPPLSLSVAKTRMGVIAAFYRGLVEGKLVGESKLKNPPYENRVTGISYISSQGVSRIKEVQTTDLSIRVPRRGGDTDTEHLYDGGKLRPLPIGDQYIIKEALEKYGNRQFELMMLTAFCTGARKQTVCTLRIGPIRRLLKNHMGKVLKLKVGTGTEIDVKSKCDSKAYILHIPRPLAQILIEYADSPEATVRRRKSFYGDSDRNYLFLTPIGNPYYTSRAEVRDREDPKFSTRISARERVDFSPSEGRALNTSLLRFIKKIRESHPAFRTFRFHDTRATYGMNFVRHFVGLGKSPNTVVEELGVRLGHTNPDTTYGYLEFDAKSERVTELEGGYEAFLSAFNPEKPG